MVDATPPFLQRLQPLPYQREILDYLRREEPDVWRWACSAEAREEQEQAVRSMLLKQTYRLDRESHADLHLRCDAVARRLGLEVPVCLWQAGEGPMNASLFFLRNEAHVVFTGPLLERLRDEELEALLGHELAHHLLWTLDDGAYHAVDRILGLSASDAGAPPAHVETARRFRLYTESFADRGAVVASGGLEPAVTTLVKVQTGLAQVSAASYLKQAAEVCTSAEAISTAPSHPEVFVRAHSLKLWCDDDDGAGADAWLATVIEGPLDLAVLDLPGQCRVAALTRRVLAQWLRPRALRTEGVLATARRFFPDIEAAADADETLAAEFAERPGMHEYVAALLADLATADRSLDDVPLAASLELAQRLGVGPAFERLALKGLGLQKRALQKLRQSAADLLARTEAAHG